MNIEFVKIDCSKTSNYINRTYTIADITLNITLNKGKPLNSFDDIIFYKIKQKAQALADKVNKGQANNSIRKRDPFRIKINAASGLLAEYIWRIFLNACHLYNYVDVTKFKTVNSKEQIDLIVLDNNKKIEVRSSFPKNGIEFALCNSNQYFDVIGPYHNNYKPSEPQKDYYLRTFYPFEWHEFFNKEVLHIYLTGGATWKMMNDIDLYKLKNFVPENELYEVESEYRVIPMKDTLDIIQLLREFNKTRS